MAELIGLWRHRRSEAGQALAEYALILGLASVAALAALGFFGLQGLSRYGGILAGLPR
jgi:Flp pilus assembly pilin Flp